ncbi:paraquat-inducible protein A [Pseudoprimorskyibacter insulae]|nr:paraquat-inducible protein A [Pseudoprimorskyibacter insulae]
MQRIAIWLNLALLVLYPLSWFAPLIRAGLLPLFGLSEISVATGILALWEKDIFLALVVILFALVAPMAKTAGLALVQFGRIGTRFKPGLRVLGTLAMADIFLISLYITVAKGIGVGTVETAWGLYLFSGCVLTSLALSYIPQFKPEQP